MIFLKIVLASDFFIPRIGGISIHLLHLGKYLVRLGHRVYVITTAGSRPSFERFREGFAVIRIPSPLYSNLIIPKKKLIIGLKNVIGEIDPDVINVHHAFSPISVSMPRAVSDRIPKILTNHSVPIGYDFYKRYWSKFTKFLSFNTVFKAIRSYDIVVAVSEIAKDFIKNFVIRPIYVIPNGIDLEEFNVKASKDEFGIDEDTTVFLMVGRASIKKGYEFGLYIFKKVLKFVPNSILLIAGPDGLFAKYIELASRVLGIGEKVRVLGHISREKLVKLFKVADLFLHCPWGGESFGIVLLEAMAGGTPIVASDGDGLKYILEKSGAGVVVKSYDPSEYVRQVLRILKDDEFRNRLIENGLNFAKKYSWSNIVKKVEYVYNLALRGE